MYEIIFICGDCITCHSDQHGELRTRCTLITETLFRDMVSGTTGSMGVGSFFSSGSQ